MEKKTFFVKIPTDSGVYLTKTLEIQPLQTALAHLNKAKLDIDQSCGGNGSCGTCVVHVENFGDYQRTEIELEMSQDRGFSENERLACQFEPRSGASLILKKCSSRH